MLQNHTFGPNTAPGLSGFRLKSSSGDDLFHALGQILATGIIMPNASLQGECRGFIRGCLGKGFDQEKCTKNVCDREAEKDDIGGQNAQGPKSWPRQSKSFSSAQPQGMAVALDLAQCPLGTGGPTGLSHLSLAHRTVEISHHPSADWQAGGVPVPLSSHHPLVQVLGLVGLKIPPFSIPLRNGWSSKHLMLPSSLLPSLTPPGSPSWQGACPEAEPLLYPGGHGQTGTMGQIHNRLKLRW